MIAIYLKNNRLLRFLMSSVDWVMLSKAGGSKFIQSFSVWIIVVPILAKMLSGFPQEIPIQLFNTTLTLQLELPFRVTAFYWCSVSFGLAGLLYTLNCPYLIKDYLNAGDFISKGGGASHILDHLNLIEDDTKSKAYMSELSELNSDNHNVLLSEIYNKVVTDIKLKRSIYRLIVMLLYILGFSLLALMFIENTIAVIGK